MLLLVLILVLLAFGLLVVALLSSTVMWAWVSVAVSVAAAIVLLIDWLQRRAAVKAGARSALESGGQSFGPPPVPAAEPPEPVTEVLPVIPRPAPAVAERPAPDIDADAGTALVQAADPPTTAAAFDTASDNQQTVIMPVVQPSGSSARPSGAEDETTASRADSSPSVTEIGSDATVATPRKGDGAEAVDARADRAEGGADADAAATVMAKLPGTEQSEPAPPQTPVAEDAEPAPVADDGGATAMVDTRKAAPAAPDAEPATQLTPSGVNGSPEPFDAEQTQLTPSGQGGQGGAATPPAADDGGQTSVFQAGGSGEQPTQVAQLPPTESGEPPEEPRDPAAAALVAGLEDEVIVVDEQPRYHVVGCRALSGTPTIPLPAREAVELGFTPCGWCNPDRTLASRHPAAAR
ncbi:hypothetical protein [Pseudonocardia sp. TRM90224]|uniref:hypothetical protein n=1 Tax=Pseudonocardia sp. TRM90224 TaxID=2812678 RepID=UPI001E34A966|nr:hypothetical protein [Pseudonocardia sp. TRM90224]